MHCPRLSELPPPPAGKSGWPWTEQTAPAPAVMPDGKAWPRISVVTPSFNQGEYLEETIRSVLLQGYPDLEYIVMDGGSTDQSVPIIRKYSAWISHWESKGDEGQSHAINQGINRATGAVSAWLNSDDTYEKGALQCIGNEFGRNSGADVISGQCRLWFGKADDELFGPSPLRVYKDFLYAGSNWMHRRLIMQPGAFFKTQAYQSVGGIPPDLKYAIDEALWLRLARAGHRFHSIPVHLANLRVHAAQKTADPFVAYQELCQLAWHYLKTDRAKFGDEAFAIADDIFSGLEQMRTHYRDRYYLLKNSTSYKLGRLITCLRFW